MSANNTVVDLLSLQDFQSTLQSRIDETGKALRTLTTPPNDNPPPLGGFQDATAAAARHQVLHDEYVVRLRHLLDALTAAQAATAHILNQYRTLEALNAASIRDITDAMRPAREARDGGHAHA